MARLAQVPQAGTAKQQVLLLIDHSVGKGGVNRPDDVQLIQFLLNIANQRNGGPFFNALSRPLVKDGKCGPKTQAAILKYQRNYNQQPGFRKGYKMMSEDALVTPSSEIMLWGAGQFHLTTMYSLNGEFHLYVNFQQIFFNMYVVEPLFSQVLGPFKAMVGA